MQKFLRREKAAIVRNVRQNDVAYGPSMAVPAPVRAETEPWRTMSGFSRVPREKRCRGFAV